MEIMKAVSFMYVRPPGYNAESAKAAEVADESKMQEENDPTQNPTTMFVYPVEFLLLSTYVSENIEKESNVLTTTCQFIHYFILKVTGWLFSLPCRSLESMPIREKKKPRPKDVFGRPLPTEEEFEVLKNAPRYC